MRRARIRAAGRREKRNGEKVGSLSDAAEEKHPRFLKYLLHFFLFFFLVLNHSQPEKLIHTHSSLIPLSQSCQLVSVPQPAIKVCSYLRGHDKTRYPVKRREGRGKKRLVRSWLQIFTSTSERLVGWRWRRRHVTVLHGEEKLPKRGGWKTIDQRFTSCFNQAWNRDQTGAGVSPADNGKLKLLYSSDLDNEITTAWCWENGVWCIKSMIINFSMITLWRKSLQSQTFSLITLHRSHSSLWTFHVEEEDAWNCSERCRSRNVPKKLCSDFIKTHIKTSESFLTSPS